MKCTKCGFDNIAEARFCENCGVALPQSGSKTLSNSHDVPHDFARNLSGVQISRTDSQFASQKGVSAGTVDSRSGKGVSKGKPGSSIEVQVDISAACEKASKMAEAGATDGAMSILLDTLSRCASNPVKNPNLGSLLNEILFLVKVANSHSQAESVIKQAYVSYKSALPTRKCTLDIANALATIYERNNLLAEAESLFREIVGLSFDAKDSPNDTAMSLNNLANVLETQGKIDEAEATYEASLQLLERARDCDNSISCVLNNLGYLAKTKGELPKAIELYERAFGLIKGDVDSSDYLRAISIAFNLSRAYQTDNLKAAIKWCKTGINMADGFLSEDHKLLAALNEQLDELESSHEKRSSVSINNQAARKMSLKPAGNTGERARVIEKIEFHIRQHLLDPNEEFVTFTVSDNENSWVQFAHMSVNAASPHEEQPDLSFGEKLLDGYVPEVIDWQANGHITYQFDKTSADHIARWIDAYFVAVLGASASGYKLDVKSSSDEVGSFQKGSNANPLSDLFGRTGPRSQSQASTITKTIGSQVGREIVRGVLGSLLGGKRK